MVGEHADDLFIAEDFHQRIYGQRIVLSQFGIRIVGRSQRLTLNYRTTAQNLAYAISVLRGGNYVDREHIKPGQPVAMTMHRAKGTEFSKVLLFGIDQGAIPRPLRDEQYAEDAWADALLRERSLLYVAATRARDELALSWSGDPSELLPGGEADGS